MQLLCHGKPVLLCDISKFKLNDTLGRIFYYYHGYSSYHKQLGGYFKSEILTYYIIDHSRLYFNIIMYNKNPFRK